jgi:hypothetical protein
MYGICWHELTEPLGRFCSASAWEANVYTLGDFWTYNFNTTRSFIGGVNGRAWSADGGLTFLANLDQSGGDYGDLAFGTTSVFASFSGWVAGVVNPMGTFPPGSNASDVAANLKILALMGSLDLTADGLTQAGLSGGGGPPPTTRGFIQLRF